MEIAQADKTLNIMKDKINIMKMPDPITRRFLKKKFFTQYLNK